MSHNRVYFDHRLMLFAENFLISNILTILVLLLTYLINGVTLLINKVTCFWKYHSNIFSFYTENQFSHLFVMLSTHIFLRVLKKYRFYSKKIPNHPILHYAVKGSDY